MIDLLIEHGQIVTVNEEREVIRDGAIAIDDGAIVDVGATDSVAPTYDAADSIDASGRVVLPGFINTHTHVSDILLRGGASEDRSLFDWLFNIKKPAINAMSPADHAVAAALYCQEALQAGITTFVELPEAVLLALDDFDAITRTKFEAYDDAGLRTVYAVTFSDNPEIPPSLATFVDRVTAAEPAVEHVDPAATLVDTDDALATIEGLLQDAADADRRQVWPAPEHIWTVTPRGFAASYELAAEYDVMTTTHASESVHDETGHLSNIEYLDGVGFLGDRALIAHCVHLDDRDVRLVAETNTRIAHNPLANLALGSGIAPTSTFLTAGITVGLGTDNPCANNTVNPIADLRFAALLHKGATRDASAVTAAQALEMATIEAAKAIGRGDDLGSIDVGKKADVVVLDLEHPHTIPQPDVVSTIVYQAQGSEVDTVVCDGEIVLDGRAGRARSDQDGSLLADARSVAAEVVERAGLPVGYEQP